MSSITDIGLDRYFTKPSTELIEEVFKNNNLYGILACQEDNKDCRVLFYYGQRTQDEIQTAAAYVNRSLICYLLSIYGQEKLIELVDITVQQDRDDE